MQIGDTRWYTAVLYNKGNKGKLERINGYRMKLSGWSETEINARVDSLAKAGICGNLKTDKHNHTDIPSGELFFQVSEKESIENLEKLFKESGIDLNPERFRAGYDYVVPHGRGGR